MEFGVVCMCGGFSRGWGYHWMGLLWVELVWGGIALGWDCFGVGLLWGWGCCGGRVAVGVGLLWGEVAVGYDAALTYFFCTYVYIRIRMHVWKPNA